MNEKEIAELFEGLEFDLADVKKSNERIARRNRIDRDPSICSCGHGKSRHQFLENRGHYSCTPSRMSCNCRHLEVVLEAEDTRDFLSKTVGNGVEHALMRGIDVTLRKGKSIRWIGTGRNCFVCKDETKKTTIVSYKMIGDLPVEVSDEGGQKNRFMCNDCREMISKKRFETGIQEVDGE